MPGTGIKVLGMPSIWLFSYSVVQTVLMRGMQVRQIHTGKSDSVAYKQGKNQCCGRSVSSKCTEASDKGT